MRTSSKSIVYGLWIWMTRTRCMHLAILCLTNALTIVTSHAATSTASERNAREEIVDVVTSDSLALEIALTWKLIGDESFLAEGGCDDARLQISRAAPAQAFARLQANSANGCRAWDEYQYAKDILAARLTLSRLNPAQQKTHALLVADIDYRQLLLSQHLGFWGGVRSLIPSIPVRHLQQMKSLLKQFEQIADEVEGSTARVEDLEIDAAKINAVTAQARGELESESINAQTQDLLRRNESVRQQTFSQRAEALEAYRATLEQRAQALRDENKAIEAGVARAIVNSVAASAGVPLEAIDAAKSGDIKRAAIAFANTDAGNQVLQSTLTQISSGSQALVDVYSKVSETAATVQDVKRSAEQIQRFVRKPSADALIELGDALYRSPYLNANQKSQLAVAVKSVKPILAATQLLEDVRLGKSPAETCRQLLENDGVAQALGVTGLPACGVFTVTSAKVCDKSLPLDQRFGGLDPNALDPTLTARINAGCEVHKTVTEVLANEPRWRDLLRQQIDANLQPFTQQGVAFLGRTIARGLALELSDEERATLIQVAMAEGGAVAYHAVLDAFPASARPQIERALRSYLKNQNVPDEAVAKMLAQDSRRPAFVLRRGTLSVQDADGKTIARIDSQNILRPLAATLESQPAAIELTRLRGHIDRLVALRGEFQTALLRELPANAVENSVTEIAKIDKRAQARLWDRTMNALPDGTQTLVEQRAGALLLGAQAAEVQLPDAPAVSADTGSAPAPEAAPTQNPINIGSTTIGPSGGGPSTEEALAAAALTAAFPAAGVALKVLQGVALSSANTQEIKRLENEQLRLIAEMVQMQELERTAQLQEAIAKQEIRVAEALIAAAREQISNYQFAMRAAAQSSDRQRARIALRRPLFFYLSERLRQEFFSFDRSLYLWAGIEGTAGHTIEQLVKSDPQNVRLALDSEIHVFDWLNRDRESTRADVDGLLQHWRQLVRLSEDLCHSEGCQPGDGLLGQLQQSPVYRLSELVDRETWKALRTWQTSANPDTFTLSFLIHPGLPGFPPAYSGLRLIDLRVATVDATGRTVLASGVTLKHPGVGIVPVHDPASGGVRFAREVLLPRQSSSFDPPDAFSLEELRTRWAGIGDPTPRYFEGYALFTSWQLTLQPDYASRNLRDLEIRFAYSYSNPDLAVHERDFVRRSAQLQERENLSVPITEWRICRAAPAAGATVPRCDPLLNSVLPALLAQALLPGDASSLRGSFGATHPTAFYMQEMPKSCANILEQLRRERVAEILRARKESSISTGSITRQVIDDVERSAHLRMNAELPAINAALGRMNVAACTL
jgi:ABC-type uncharacterized transport system YnjBCD ATPase subunit